MPPAPTRPSTVDSRIESLGATLNASGNEMVESLTVRAEDYVARLSTTGTELVENLSQTGTTM